jgi:hypothetical protein
MIPIQSFLKISVLVRRAGLNAGYEEKTPRGIECEPPSKSTPFLRSRTERAPSTGYCVPLSAVACKH